MRFKSIVIFVLATAVILTACTSKQPPVPPLEVSQIRFSSELIEDGKEIPEFKTMFDTGSTVIYSYIWFDNTETLTGAYKVQMSWFYPNDLRPPIARHVIEMQPDQTIAQFSLHNEDGLVNGPYKAIVRAGLADAQLTASGSARLFIGMSKADADEYLKQEAEFLKKREEERKRKEAERKKREEEEAKKKALLGTGSSLTGGTITDGTMTGAILENGAITGGTLKSKTMTGEALNSNGSAPVQNDELPPGLLDGEDK